MLHSVCVVNLEIKYQEIVVVVVVAGFDFHYCCLFICLFFAKLPNLNA